MWMGNQMERELAEIIFAIQPLWSDCTSHSATFIKSRVTDWVAERLSGCSHPLGIAVLTRMMFIYVYYDHRSLLVNEMVYGGESHNITTSWGFFFPAIHSNWAILEQLTKGNEINEMKFCRFLWVLRVPILKLKPLNLRTWGLSLFLSFSLSFSLSLHPHQSLPTCIENYYNAILKVHNEIFAHASDYGTPNGSETWLQEMEILESQELRQYRFRTSFTPKQGQNFPPEVWSCPSLSHLLMFCHLRWLSHPSEKYAHQLGSSFDW